MTVGSWSVGTPGLVAGLWEAYQKEGSGAIAWKDLLAPAIALAEGGFKVYPHLAAKLLDEQKVLNAFPESARIFLKEGKPRGIGDLLVQQDLAKTLKNIAAVGAPAFYQGAVAESITKTIQKGSGLLNSSDLKGYRPVWREPIQGIYKGSKINSMPPPSSGGIHVVEILNILENFNLASKSPQDVKAIHWTTEAMRRAFADRAHFLGDPDFVVVPVKGLVSKKYASDLAATIAADKATPSQLLGEGRTTFKESDSTAHISIVDAEGNAVATTQSINQPFGSRQSQAQRLRRAETSCKGAIQICNPRSMIHKLKFHTHSLSAAQDRDAGDTLLGVDPDIPAEFRSRRCQRSHGELIKPMLLRKLSHSLSHRHNVGLFIDPDLPCLPVDMMNPGWRQHFHEPPNPRPEVSTGWPEVEALLLTRARS